MPLLEAELEEEAEVEKWEQTWISVCVEKKKEITAHSSPALGEAYARCTSVNAVSNLHQDGASLGAVAAELARELGSGLFNL